MMKIVKIVHKTFYWC